MDKSELYILLGPSGSGKSKLAADLREYVPELVTCTTRDMREGEKEGIDYYFVDESYFWNHEMVENVKIDGNLYGLSWKELNDKLSGVDENYLLDNKKVFIIMERNGVENLKKVLGDKLDINVIYVISDIEDIIDRLERDRSYKEAFNRLSRIIIEGELSNYDIADYTILNKEGDGEYIEALKKLYDIVLGFEARYRVLNMNLHEIDEW